MSTSQDTERRLRRRSAFWRLVAIAAVIALLVVSFADFSPKGPYIARHEVLGVIYDDPLRDDLLAGVADDPDARALILRIDSPGGTTVGSEALYESIRAVAAEKPVIAVMGEVAASGGYIAALAADQVVARGNTITGSIGVIMQFSNYEKLLDTVGVQMREVKSGPFKAQPNPFSETSDEVKAHERDMIADSFDWFRGLVAERRGLDDAALNAVTDGRVFTGRMALAAGLIDQIGGEPDAITWLVEEKGVESTLPIRDRQVTPPDESLFDTALDRLIGRATSGVPVEFGGGRLLSLLK